MNKIFKFSKILIVFILIFSLLFMQTETILGRDLDGARGESGSRPPPPTPPDAPLPPIEPSKPSEPSEPTIPTITVEHYTSISGNVYEDIGEVFIGTEGNDARDKCLAVPQVIVNLKSGDTIVDSRVTDGNGHYSFSPPPGSYSLEYIYGYLSESDLNSLSTENVRKRLRYNGHDYITVKTPGNQDYEFVDVLEWEIMQGGKGAAQVYLALDCSVSMRRTKVTQNGVTKTRLQVAAEAAKRLTEKLLDSGENIYVGLIIFSGTTYRAVSLTKEKNIIYNALDDIVSNEWQTPNTNVVAALDKALESYANNDKENSNRYLAILSDGSPTSDGVNQVYNDMSDEEVLNVLEKVDRNTKNKVRKLRENGVKVFSLMVESDDEEENQCVREIFGQSDIFISTKDGNEMVERIEVDLKEYIITTTESKTYTSGGTILAGYEDADRRKEVDEKFETFKYDNTIYFSQIENYNGTAIDKEQAYKLSQDTFMRVQGGTGYNIDEMPEVTEEEVYNSEGELVAYIKHIAVAYDGQNVYLAQRPALSMVVKTTATGLKVTLANGGTLDIHTRDWGSDLPIIQTIDGQLAHGATVLIEYTINIKNDSSIQCNYLELINYLPEQCLYIEDASFITTDGTNNDVGWEVISSLENLVYKNGIGYISENTLNTYRDRQAQRIVLDNNGQGENGFYIAPGGEYQLKIVASRVITSLEEIRALQNSTEVLVYENSANRRMAYVKGIPHPDYPNSNIKILEGVFPGDSQGEDFSKSTNGVFVIPPTGGQKYEIQNIILASILPVTVLVIGIVWYKKKIKNKKTLL